MRKCRDDEIRTTFTVEPINYKIGLSGKLVISPTWEESKVADCPTEFLVLKKNEVDDDWERLMSNAIVKHSNINGSITVSNSADRSVAGQTWKLKVVKRSTYS